ncbi:MAG: universal stress protein [Euryarchaeota archaeon]|nr:universal stress protein [Euryarchaeota archaeon]
MMILVGYDGSDPSRKAIEHSLKRMEPEKDEVVVLTVVPKAVAERSFVGMLLPTADMSGISDDKTFVESAKARVSEVVESVKKRGYRARGHVKVGNAADELIAAAEELKVDEICLGYKSYEKQTMYFIGSVAEKVVRHSNRTVTIVR